MDHLEAIVEIKNAISPTFIKQIVPLINKKSKKYLGIRMGTRKDIRNVKGYSLNFKTPTNLFYWNYIKEEIQRLYPLYKARFPRMASQKINQIDLLKYSIGGKYEFHTDNFTTATRHLSIIMNLNEDYKGGELAFADQKNVVLKKLKLGKRSIVFFPSNFMYPHSIQPITEGTRYSIVAWLQ